MYKTNCSEISGEDLDTEYIPQCKGPEKIDTETRVQSTKVFFDLETTGLGLSAEITQASAWYSK